MSDFKTADRAVMELLTDGGEELPLETKRTAKVLADVVGSVDSDWAGARPPYAVAAGCVYVADWVARGPDRMTQRDFEDIVEVSHNTIARHYKDIPSVFFERAGEDDLDRLSDIATRRLRLLADARELGFELKEIDPWTHSLHDRDS